MVGYRLHHCEYIDSVYFFSTGTDEIQLLCQPIVSAIKIVIEIWHFLLYTVGLLEVAERPLAFVYFLAICLVISFMISEVGTLLLRSIDSFQGSRRRPKPLPLGDTAEPETPHAPGRFPRTPQTPITPESLVYEPSVEDVESEDSDHSKDASSSSMLKSALKKTANQPRQHIIKPQMRLSVFPQYLPSGERVTSAQSPFSPWSLPPIWEKLLRGLRSPGVRRKWSAMPLFSPEPQLGDVCIESEHDPRGPTPNTTQVTMPSQMTAKNRAYEAVEDGSLQQLDDLEKKLSNYLTQYRDFSGNTNLNSKTTTQRLQFLSNAVEKHILFPLDAFIPGSDANIRLQRKNLVDRTQDLLNDLDRDITSTAGKNAASDRNPIYGDVSNLIPAAFKITPVLTETHKQCKIWAGRMPPVYHVIGSGSKLTKVCANVYWTSEFLDVLCDIIDEQLGLLPDDLFDICEPEGVLDDIHTSLKVVMEAYCPHPNVIPIDKMGLPFVKNIKMKLDALEKRIKPRMVPESKVQDDEKEKKRQRKQDQSVTISTNAQTLPPGINPAQHRKFDEKSIQGIRVKPQQKFTSSAMEHGHGRKHHLMQDQRLTPLFTDPEDLSSSTRQPKHQKLDYMSPHGIDLQPWSPIDDALGCRRSSLYENH